VPLEAGHGSLRGRYCWAQVTSGCYCSSVMGIEFTLSDRELPASPAFVKFLAGALFGAPNLGDAWTDQVSEYLSSPRQDEVEIVDAAARQVMADAAGRALVVRAYRYLLALLTGDLAPLIEFQSRFQAISVVGVPRTGGSYLTAELYRSLGIAPDEVPNALAHDSFPVATPFALEPGTNGWVNSLKTMAEYMVMVEVFFGERRAHCGKIVVPKKLTQAVYAAAFVQSVLGNSTTTILTLRHPVAACVSMYEKSGGLPSDKRFVVRSNIEEWCRRDVMHSGCSDAQFEAMDYFEVYLRYWELYHLSIVTSGLVASRNLQTVTYGKAAFEALARRYHREFGSALDVAEFQIAGAPGDRHPDWTARAQPALERVAAAWRVVGLSFPLREIASCT